MILSDTTMHKRLKQGDLGIDPLMAGAMQPASIDLHLGNSFRVFEYSRETCIDPLDKITVYTREIVLEEGKCFILHPGNFTLGTTLERVKIPLDLVGRLDGKSSLGRVGVIVHATAGHVNPGWDGQLTLELSNVGKLPVKLYYNMAICQISFLMLTEPASIGYGDKSLGSRYQGQTGATEGKN